MGVLVTMQCSRHIMYLSIYYMYICMCVCIYICMYTCICKSVFMYVGISVCMYAYMHRELFITAYSTWLASSVICVREKGSSSLVILNVHLHAHIYDHWNPLSLLPLSLSLYLSTCMFVCLYVCVSVCLFLSFPFSLSLPLSLSLYLFLSHSTCPFFYCYYFLPHLHSLQSICHALALLAHYLREAQPQGSGTGLRHPKTMDSIGCCWAREEDSIGYNMELSTTDSDSLDWLI